jgi:hypothetical protein
MVLACSHSRSLQLLARLDARTEFKILEHSLKGGVEAGRAHHCKVSTRTILPNFIDLSAEAALYSRFGGYNGGVVKGEQRKRTSSI